MRDALHLLALLTTILLPLLPGCSSDDDGSSPDAQVGVGSMIATINGRTYRGELAVGTTGELDGDNSLVIVSVFDSNNPASGGMAIVFLDLSNEITAGDVFTCRSPDTFLDCPFFSLSSDAESTNDYSSENLTVTITSGSGTVGATLGGTFAGIVVDEDTGEELALTNGRFQVPITE